MTCVFCTYMQVYMADESASKLQLVAEFDRDYETVPENSYLTLLRETVLIGRLNKEII